ncbi:MAG: PTS sugar transporter subunit IIA [Planctomycetota bacterium]
MKLLDFLVKGATIENLVSDNKESVVEELVQALAKTEVIKASVQKEIIQKVMEREQQGSTGIGNCLAVPHLKQTVHVEKTVGVFGRSKAGIPFGAIDGVKCHLFFLILNPKKEMTAHLEALRRVAHLSKDIDFCRYLKDAKNLKEILELLEEADER